MSTTPLIKICGMRNPENISRIVALKPDYLGFILYPLSKRYLGPDYKLIVPIPDSIKRVGVFVNALIADVMHWVNRLELDYVQLHGNESPEYCKELNHIGIPCIKAFGVDDNFNFDILEAWLPYCHYFLFDTKTPEHGGSGQAFNWKILMDYPFEKPFFLSGGIGPEDAQVLKEIKDIPLHAVDVNSRFEQEPGVKNVEMLKNFIFALRE